MQESIIQDSLTTEGNSLSVDETENDLLVGISSDMKCSYQCLYAFHKASKIRGMIKRTIEY